LPARGRPRCPRLPYTTLFRSVAGFVVAADQKDGYAVFGGECGVESAFAGEDAVEPDPGDLVGQVGVGEHAVAACRGVVAEEDDRSEEHTSELQSRENLVCRLL